MRWALRVAVAGLGWMAPFAATAEDKSSAAEQQLLSRANQMRLQLDGASGSARAAAARVKVSPPQALQLKAIGKQLAKDPRSAAALRDWQRVVASMRPAAADINGLVQLVLRESYLQQQDDLRAHAEKVKRFNTIKELLRREIQRARSHGVRVSSGARAAPLIPDPNLGRQGVLAARPPVQSSVNAQAYITALEQKLTQIGDDAQLANVDLQNTLQKQQQTLQMLSNIAKQLHDTAQAVIRKIGG